MRLIAANMPEKIGLKLGIDKGEVTRELEEIMGMRECGWDWTKMAPCPEIARLFPDKVNWILVMIWHHVSESDLLSLEDVVRDAGSGILAHRVTNAIFDKYFDILPTHDYLFSVEKTWIFDNGAAKTIDIKRPISRDRLEKYMKSHTIFGKMSGCYYDGFIEDYPELVDWDNIDLSHLPAKRVEPYWNLLKNNCSLPHEFMEKYKFHLPTSTLLRYAHFCQRSIDGLMPLRQMAMFSPEYEEKYLEYFARIYPGKYACFFAHSPEICREYEDVIDWEHYYGNIPFDVCLRQCPNKLPENIPLEAGYMEFLTMMPPEIVARRAIGGNKPQILHKLPITLPQIISLLIEINPFLSLSALETYLNMGISLSSWNIDVEKDPKETIKILKKYNRSLDIDILYNCIPVVTPFLDSLCENNV